LAAEAAQSVRWIASDATFKRAWLTERVMTVLERRSKTVRGKSAVKLTKNALLTLAKGRADCAPLISQNLFLRFLSRPEIAPPSVLVVAEPHQDGPPERSRTLRPRLAAMVTAVESPDAREPPKTKGPLRRAGCPGYFWVEDSYQPATTPMETQQRLDSNMFTPSDVRWSGVMWRLYFTLPPLSYPSRLRARPAPAGV
jgi:hypothetical protein